jgi:uncharacterized membrane protein YgdD (TMEM256/DUF423 family)
MPHPKVKIADNSGNEVAVTDNALDVNIAGGTTIDIGDVEILGHQDIDHGSNTSVSDTTAEYLYGDATSVACKHIDIMASISNTGIIYVGATGVTAATGIALYAGDVYSVDITNIRKIFVIASVDTEDVQWVIYN